MSSNSVLLWEIENLSVAGRCQPREVHSPVTLRLTDNPETDKDLRVESLAGENIATLVDADWDFESKGVRFEGYVSRPGRKRDTVETWFAKPMLDADSGPVAWKVEVVLAESAKTIQVTEPAVVEELDVVPDARGQRIALHELGWDEYADPDEVDRLLAIRDSRGKKRWIDDYDFRWFNRYEVSLDGTTKHKRQQVKVIVKLTPSGVKRAAELLGGSV